MRILPIFAMMLSIRAQGIVNTDSIINLSAEKILFLK